MKTKLILTFIVATSFVVQISCNDKPKPKEEAYDGSKEAEFPTERLDISAVACGETFDFGKIGFVSTQTWTIYLNNEPLTWSAPVITSNCYKTNFDAGNYSESFYNVDCRTQDNKTNRTKYGDLFSWCAVNNYATILCPAGWRVPTMEDFINLDIALGGTGENYQLNTTLRNKYLNDWGGNYGGFSFSDGTLDSQEEYAFYWSQSEHDTDKGYYLYFTKEYGIVTPASTTSKSQGFTLRCVK